jgi:hypothetical protein
LVSALSFFSVQWNSLMPTVMISCLVFMLLATMLWVVFTALTDGKRGNPTTDAGAASSANAGLPGWREVEREFEKVAPQLEAMLEEDVRELKEETIKDGSANLPRNYGDLLLERAATDEKIKTGLEWKRREGMRDEDFRWWWNMQEYERRMLARIAERDRVATYLALRAQGKMADEAGAGVWKAHTFFGGAEGEGAGPRGPSALPWELMDRIRTYIEQCTRSQPDQYRAEVNSAPDFNTFVRAQITLGRL